MKDEEVIEIVSRYPLPSNPNWVEGKIEDRKYSIKKYMVALREAYVAQANIPAGWALEQIKGLAIAIKTLESSSLTKKECEEK